MAPVDSNVGRRESRGTIVRIPWRRLLRPILLVGVSLLVGRIIIGLIGSIDWGAVVSSLARLSWTSLPLLVGLLLVRQSFNAIPLARFVPGLGWWRSAQNDVTANLLGVVTPPPGDVVIRVSMFRSWGLNPVDGMAGVTLNSLTFYVIRFAAPALGVVVLVGEELSTGRTWLAVGSLAIAAVIVVALVLVSRGERLAFLVGTVAGSVVARFREDTEPERWGAAVLDFRGRMSTRLSRGLPGALAALAGMVIVDGLVLLAALRSVGVPADALSAVWVLGAFLIAYPLTALPLAGLGVLDAALVVAFVDVAGTSLEPEVVAGLIVWRLVTIGGPLLLGLLALGNWRRNVRGDDGMEGLAGRR
ncbi:MAG: hypothetical protein GC156_09520 [Actinomycetales bacterium]|nr:hypothetical protein [Actinomycetales bacterium]